MFTDRASSLDRSSPELAPPPAKRQQTNRAGKAIPNNKRAGRGQVAGSWPPPTTTADEPLPPTKFTETELPDPSTLAQSLSMVIELNDDSNLSADEQRRLQEELRFSS